MKANPVFPNDITVKVFNQEKTSQEQIQRVHHKVQSANKARIDFAKKEKSKTTSGKGFFSRLKLRSTCTRMMGRKKVWIRLATAHDPKHTTSSVKHSGAA